MAIFPLSLLLVQIAALAGGLHVRVKDCFIVESKLKKKVEHILLATIVV